MRAPRTHTQQASAPLAALTAVGTQGEGARVSDTVWKQAQEGHLATWRRYAEEGRRADPDRGDVWRAILAHVEHTAPIRSGERVLDIGCGLDTVLDFLPSARGFTLDSLMHVLAPFELREEAHHASGAMEMLPYADGAFDRVFLMNVLDHVFGPHEGIREIARVVRPGGVLVLSVDTYAGGRYLQKRARKWYDRKRGARTKHPWVFSNASVESLLRASGFEPGPPSHVTGTKDRRTLFVSRRSR